MNQDLIDRALQVAIRIAISRGTNLDREALVQALISVTGEGTDQYRPEEIAEEAELLGIAPGGASSKSGRRPF